MAGITELEAINYMLINAGEQPVTSLTGADLATDTTTARFMLGVVTKEIQERGMDENVFEKLIPMNQTDGSFPLPPQTIDVYLRNDIRWTDVTGEERSTINVAPRDNKIYNIDQQTFDFSDYSDQLADDNGMLRVVVKVYIDFEDLNPTTKRTTMEEAARRYQLATQASPQVDGFLSQRTQLSRMNHRANDINNKSRNLFDGSDMRRSFAVDRNIYGLGGYSNSDAIRRGNR